LRCQQLNILMGKGLQSQQDPSTIGLQGYISDDDILDINQFDGEIISYDADATDAKSEPEESSASNMSSSDSNDEASSNTRLLSSSIEEDPNTTIICFTHAEMDILNKKIEKPVCPVIHSMKKDFVKAAKEQVFAGRKTSFPLRASNPLE